MKEYKYKKSHQGFTLIELLISMTISIILLTSILRIYLWFEEIEQQRQGLLYLQENANIAWHFLANEISTAGYIGCPNFETVTIKALPAKINFSLQHIIHINQHFSRYGDAIEIKKMALLPMNNAKDFTVLSNCQSVKVVPANARGLQKIDLHAQSAYQISPFIDEVFFIKNTGRQTAKGKPILALYRQYLFPTVMPVEIVEGITALHVYPIFNVKNIITAVDLIIDLQSPQGLIAQWRGIIKLRERLI